MKKEDFLNELREKISVLNKEEQDDIINEYKEHIEEKLKKKQKEEKIIEELGSVEELSREILDAYKINEEYSNKKAGVKFFETCNNVIETIVEKFAKKSFGEIVRFILELLIILLLIAVLKLPFVLIESLGDGVFNSLLSPVGSILEDVWRFLIELCYLVIAFFVFINIFKVRYLDNNIKKKKAPMNNTTKSTSIKKNDTNNINLNKEKNTVSAVDTGANILYSFFKVIMVILGLPFIFTFIFLCIALGVVLFVGFSSKFFFGIILCVLALIVANIWLLDIIYRIIFDKAFHGLRVFFTIIGVVIAFTLGMFLSFFEISRLEVVDNNSKITQTETKEKDVILGRDVTNVFCSECYTKNQVVKIDNTLNNKMKIKIDYLSNIEKVRIDDQIPFHYEVYTSPKLNNIIDLYFENLKKDKIISLDNIDNLKVTVYINNKDLNKVNLFGGDYYLNGVYQGDIDEIGY